MLITDMKKAFDDIVVLDFTRYLTGPYASYLLGHMGAYVIKVEKPYVGEDFRQFPPFYNGESLAYPLCAANKRSICMNLRDDRAKELLLELLPHIDILMQNFRTGTIEKMGFDWETIHKINPRLIMANFSAFGQYGPYSRRLAFDSIIQSETGLTNAICEESGGKPYYPGGDNSGFMGALCYASAIAAAINERDRTGEGTYLDIDMMSAVVNMFSPELSLHEAAGFPQKIHNFAPFSFYRDASGRFIQITCPEPLWQEFKAVVADPELDSERFATLADRREHKAELDAAVERWSAQRAGEEICALLEAKGIGAGIVRNYKDLPVNEHVQATDALKYIDVPYVGKVPYPEVPLHMSESPIQYGKVSKIGEDNYEVFHQLLNKTHEEVSELLAAGVLYQAEHSTLK